MENFEPFSWKKQAFFVGIHARRTNKDVSNFLSVRRRMVEKVRKDLNDSEFNYWVTAERKTYAQ